ncbi:MAG: hypothetical protein R3E78_17320 [Burkholderiaceae bacterium]
MVSDAATRLGTDRSNVQVSVNAPTMVLSADALRSSSVPRWTGVAQAPTAAIAIDAAMAMRVNFETVCIGLTSCLSDWDRAGIGNRPPLQR